MRKLLRMNPIPDGICCYNDSVAIGTTTAIVEHKLRAPDDVAVIGAGNVRSRSGSKPASWFSNKWVQSKFFARRKC